MPGGRPRKPLAEKLELGTYRADRDGPLESQVVAAGVPEPPATLQGRALGFWHEVVPRLVSARVAAACDAPQLAELCKWWERSQRFGEMLDAPDLDAKEAYKLTCMVGMSWGNFDKIASRFGLTPSDRAKLRIDPSQAAQRVPSRKR